MAAGGGKVAAPAVDVAFAVGQVGAYRRRRRVAKAEEAASPLLAHLVTGSLGGGREEGAQAGLDGVFARDINQGRGGRGALGFGGRDVARQHEGRGFVGSVVGRRHGHLVVLKMLSGVAPRPAPPPLARGAAPAMMLARHRLGSWGARASSFRPSAALSSSAGPSASLS